MSDKGVSGAARNCSKVSLENDVLVCSPVFGSRMFHPLIDRGRAPFCAAQLKRTRRSGSLTGSDFNSTSLTRLKMTVLAPMPRASEATATTAKPGVLRRLLRANLRSSMGWRMWAASAFALRATAGSSCGQSRRRGSRGGERRTFGCALYNPANSPGLQTVSAQPRPRIGIEAHRESSRWILATRSTWPLAANRS